MFSSIVFSQTGLNVKTRTLYADSIRANSTVYGTLDTQKFVSRAKFTRLILFDSTTTFNSSTIGFLVNNTGASFSQNTSGAYLVHHYTGANTYKIGFTGTLATPITSAYELDYQGNGLFKGTVTATNLLVPSGSSYDSARLFYRQDTTNLHALKLWNKFDKSDTTKLGYLSKSQTWAGTNTFSISLDTASTNAVSKITGDPSSPISVTKASKDYIIGMPQVTSSISGWLTWSDWQLFNGKANVADSAKVSSGIFTTVGYVNHTATVNVDTTKTFNKLADNIVSGSNIFTNKNYFDTTTAKLINSVALQSIHQVYFMGNSLTADGTYPSYIGALLGSFWNSVNKGISGQTTPQMLARFSSDIISHTECEYVVILGGINDIKADSSISSIKINLQAMYTAAHNAGIKVVAITLLPFKGNVNWTAGRQTNLNTINTWITTTAINIDYIVNPYTTLENGSTDSLLSVYDSGDHLHLSTIGYDTLASYIYSNVIWTKRLNFNNGSSLAVSGVSSINQDLLTTSSPTFNAPIIHSLIVNDKVTNSGSVTVTTKTNVGLLIGDVFLNGANGVDRASMNIGSSNGHSLFRIGQSATAYIQGIWAYNAVEASAYFGLNSLKGIAINVNGLTTTPSSATDLAIGATTITTSATINGQTISSSANYTGTLTTAGEIKRNGTGSNQGITLNTTTTGWASLKLQNDASTKFILGIARSASDVVSGSAAGDIIFRTVGGKFRFTSNGTTNNLIGDSLGRWTILEDLTVLGDSINATSATIYSLAVKTTGLSSFGTNAGHCTIGAGDTTRVAVTGLTSATGEATVSYRDRFNTSTVVADTIPTYKIYDGFITPSGKFGWVVSYFIGKK